MLPQLDAPIVLAHGMFGFNFIGRGRWRLASYFRGIPERLEAVGNRVIVTRVHPTAGPVRRGRKLAERINAVLPDGPFHLIGHSMGGLDGRVLASDPAWRRRMLSVTTIGTPHLGTPLAEIAQDRYRRTYRFLDWIGWDYSGFLAVAPGPMRTFNRRFPVPDDLTCLSVGGDPEPPEVCRLLKRTHAWLDREVGSNDGLVPVDSAMAFGTSLPSWPLDHCRQINWFVRHREGTPAWTLYATILNRLAEMGFGEPADDIGWDQPGQAALSVS